MSTARKITYQCSACDLLSLVYSFHCPSCRCLNSMVATRKKPPSIIADNDDESIDNEDSEEECEDDEFPQRACDVDGELVERVQCGIAAVDEAVGDDEASGFALGSCLMLYACPGLGKTRLMASIALRFADQGKLALIASGEMLKPRMRSLLESVGPWTKKSQKNVLVQRTTNADKVVACAEKEEPDIIVVDSLQYFETSTAIGAAGSPNQVSAVAKMFADLSAAIGAVTGIICHENKEGNLAGPRYAEHAVDVVLGMSSCDNGLIRIAADKNRYGHSRVEKFLRMARGRLVDAETKAIQE